MKIVIYTQDMCGYCTNAIKEFSDWPTIPQLYIRGEFIGGADIVHEMYETGELKRVLQQRGYGF